jgi:hypothetical protein
VAEYLDVNPERINAVRRAARMLLSLEAPLGEDGELTRGDLIADDLSTEAAADSAEATDLSKRLESALDELNPRQRQVLRCGSDWIGAMNARWARWARSSASPASASCQIEAEALAQHAR